MKNTLLGTNIRPFVLTLTLLVTDVLSQLATINLPVTLVETGTQVEPVKTGLTYCEGPLVDTKGNLFFSEQNKGIVWKVTPAGVSSQWRTGIDTPNGMDIGITGDIICCENQRLTRLDTNGAVLEVIVKNAAYGKINDLTLNIHGALFFTNNDNNFFFRSPSGTVTTFSNYNVNGIEWVEEKNYLYLNMCNTNKVAKFSLNDSGAIDINSRKDIVSSVRIPDGITVDADYNIYVASYDAGKIFVYDSTGKMLGDITMKQGGTTSGNTSNCVFGGKDFKTLYITGNGGAYKIALKVAGRKRPHATRIIPRKSLQSAPGSLENGQTQGMIINMRGRVVGPTTGVSQKTNFAHAKYITISKSTHAAPQLDTHLK